VIVAVVVVVVYVVTLCRNEPTLHSASEKTTEPNLTNLTFNESLIYEHSK